MRPGDAVRLRLSTNKVCTFATTATTASVTQCTRVMIWIFGRRSLLHEVSPESSKAAALIVPVDHVVLPQLGGF